MAPIKDIERCGKYLRLQEWHGLSFTRRSDSFVHLQPDLPSLLLQIKANMHQQLATNILQQISMNVLLQVRVNTPLKLPSNHHQVLLINIWWVLWHHPSHLQLKMKIPVKKIVLSSHQSRFSFFYLHCREEKSSKSWRYGACFFPRKESNSFRSGVI